MALRRPVLRRPPLTGVVVADRSDTRRYAGTAAADVYPGCARAGAGADARMRTPGASLMENPRKGTVRSPYSPRIGCTATPDHPFERAFRRMTEPPTDEVARRATISAATRKFLLARTSPEQAGDS